MGTEEVGPELARFGGEEGNGVAEEGDGVRNRWRGASFCGPGSGGGGAGKDSMVFAGGVEAYNRQDADHGEAWRDYE